MLYENFYYMVFTCHSAAKIWSLICTQDIVLHYQINPIWLTWLVFWIRFVWQANPVKMIVYTFKTQRRIKNLVKHLSWTFFQKSYRLKTLNGFWRRLHLSQLGRFWIRFWDVRSYFTQMCKVKKNLKKKKLCPLFMDGVQLPQS